MIKGSPLSLSEYQGAVFGTCMVVWGVFILCPAWWEAVVSTNVWIEGAHFYIAMVPFSVLDLCGSLIVCIYYRNDMTKRSIYRSTLESMAACTLMQFGGTTFTGVLLGQAPSWMVSHTAFNSLLLAWWLVFFSPYDAFYRLVSDYHTLTIPLISVGAAVSSGHAVTSWGVDKVVYNQFHVNQVRISQSIWTCLACGTVSCCGGTLLKDWLNMMGFPSFAVCRSPILFEVERRGSPPGSPVKNVGFVDGTQGSDDDNDKRSGGSEKLDSLLLQKRQQQGLVSKCFVLATLYYTFLDPSDYVKDTFAPIVANLPLVGDAVGVIFRQGWSHDDARCLIVLLQLAHYTYKVFAPSADDVVLPYMRLFCGSLNISSTVPASRA